MEQSNKELIKEIADLFEDYEESYVPGEWESFQKHKKKKYPFSAQWLKIAAVMLLTVSVLPYSINKMLRNKGDKSAQDKQQHVVHIKPEAQNHAGSNSSPAATSGSNRTDFSGDRNNGKLETAGLNQAHSPAALPKSESAYFRNQPVLNHQTQSAALQKREGVVAAGKMVNADQNSAGAGERQTYETAKTAIPGQEYFVPSSASANQVLAQHQLKPGAPERNSGASKDTITISSKSKLSTAEFLLAESRTAAKKEKKKAALSKWDFGLQVMPTATRTNMNLGAGLVTAYHISDKLSLSSGITLMQLGSGENVPDAGPVMAADAPAFSAGSKTAQGSRQLLSIDANIKAIDIPLGIVYQLNKHYYTSTGVSYFNILSEKRNNKYAEITPVSRVSTDPATGTIQNYTALETQEVDEPTTEQPLRGNSYLGFFNFSIGRRQQLFKQYNIQIEPFIKVPIGKLSSQDLNLMNSGVKLQLSF
jgi:hypothetical protein